MRKVKKCLHWAPKYLLHAILAIIIISLKIWLYLFWILLDPNFMQKIWKKEMRWFWETLLQTTGRKDGWTQSRGSKIRNYRKDFWEQLGSLKLLWLDVPGGFFLLCHTMNNGCYPLNKDISPVTSTMRFVCPSFYFWNWILITYCWQASRLPLNKPYIPLGTLFHQTSTTSNCTLWVSVYTKTYNIYCHIAQL